MSEHLWLGNNLEAHCCGLQCFPFFLFIHFSPIRCSVRLWHSQFLPLRFTIAHPLNDLGAHCASNRKSEWNEREREQRKNEKQNEAKTFRDDVTQRCKRCKTNGEEKKTFAFCWKRSDTFNNNKPTNVRAKRSADETKPLFCLSGKGAICRFAYYCVCFFSPRSHETFCRMFFSLFANTIWESGRHWTKPIHKRQAKKRKQINTNTPHMHKHTGPWGLPQKTAK